MQETRRLIPLPAGQLGFTWGGGRDGKLAPCKSSYYDRQAPTLDPPYQSIADIYQAGVTPVLVHGGQLPGAACGLGAGLWVPADGPRPLVQSQERQVLPRTTHAGTLSAQVFLLLRRLHNRGSGQLSLPSGGRLKRGPARVCWAPSGLRLVAATEMCLWAEACAKSVAPAHGLVYCPCF